MKTRKRLSWVLVSALASVLVASTGCKGKDRSHDDARGASASAKDDKPGASRGAGPKPASGDEGPSGGDPAEGIAACSDWRAKLSACAPLKKTAPTLIDKTKDVWRMKKLGRSEIEKDCKDRIDLLPSACK